MSDLLAVALVAAVIAVFAVVPGAGDLYRELERSHGMFLSFLKFAVLATFGEMLSLRLSEGVYLKPGFGLLPKALVWGILGMAIKSVFIVFAGGVPALLEYLDVASAPSFGARSASRFMTAFSVSLVMNLVFSPVLMVVHKVTDLHIASTGGTMGGFFTLPDCTALLKRINWEVMWHFVFKKTIPLFWLPAHTITFLLPAELRVAFAAALGVALGGILALAGNKK